jgi:hypothetical protein
MPFTVSHAAAAGALWPALRRLRIPLTAVVVGTMSPDFEYFIRLRTLSLWGHSITGLVTFCLPAGLVVLAAWEWIARGPTIDLFGLRGRYPTVARDAAWWARAAIGILIGAATHVLWDSFTHAGRWGVQQFPALTLTAASVSGRPVPWFIVLDQASTVAGGLFVLGWLARSLWTAGAFRVILRSPWRLTVVVFLGASAVALGLWNGSRQSPGLDYWSGELWLAQATVGAQLGLGLAIIIFGMMYMLRARG